MSRVTLAAVNVALAAKNIDGELLKGNGYFYFWGPAFDRCSTASVFVTSLNQLTLEQWMSEANHFIEESNW